MRAIIRLAVALVTCFVSLMVFHAVTQGGTRAKIPLAGPGAHAFPPHSASLYRLAAAGDALLSLNARSLADRPRRMLHTDLRPSAAQNTAVLATADGARFLVVNQLPSHTSALRPSDITLQLFDSRTGKPLSSANHPPAVVGITGVSADGAVAYGLRLPDSNPSCGPSQFYVINTLTGGLVRRVTIGATFWTPTLVAPGLRYLYAMTTRDGIGPCGSRNPRYAVVSAYDLQTGALVHRVRLTSVLAGHWLTNRIVSWGTVAADWMPGFALSPDGKQIAILDAHRDALALLSAPSLRIEGTESIIPQTSGLESIAVALGLIPAVAEAKGQSQGINLQMQYMPQGRSLLVTGTRFLPDNNHPVARAQSLGIWLVDVARGRITASLRGRRRIMGVWPAPDGSAVYSEAQGWHQGQGWLTILRRHDPASLQVTARRTFTHTTWLPLVFLRRQGS